MFAIMFSFLLSTIDPAITGLKEGRNPERKAFLTLAPDSNHHENTIYETRTNFVKSGAA
jgi:hypothetical protein